MLPFDCVTSKTVPVDGYIRAQIDYCVHVLSSLRKGKVDAGFPKKTIIEEREVNKMKRPVKRWLFWTPRVLCIGFAVFISLFALDVFQEGAGFWRTMAALGMHLIPAGIVLVLLALAWRWEWVGGIVLIGMGGWYISDNLNRPGWCLLIAGPAILIGILFLLNWHYRDQLRAQL
jgi:hypothetical protein